MVYIYYLSQNDIPFYVGKTKNINLRLIIHKGIFGNQISITKLDEVSNEKQIWKFWECFYILEFKKLGYPLQNKNKGGGGPEFLSEYSRSLISAKNKGNSYYKGKKRSEETKRKIGLSNKNKPRPGAGRTGIKWNENHYKIICKPVIQTDLDGNFIAEFPSITEAKKFTKIKGIANVVSNIANTAGNFKWKYKCQQF